MQQKASPAVKITPEFKAGDRIACKSTGEEFEILSVTPDGDYICKGRAGIMPKSAAEKPLTPAEKAELAED